MPLGTLLALAFLWIGVSAPLTFVGSYVGFKKPPPDDPVLKARVDWIEKQGKNPFMEYQLPRAVISMKQGAGRLIGAARRCSLMVF